jgi:hypothetical protein
VWNPLCLWAMGAIDLYVLLHSHSGVILIRYVSVVGCEEVATFSVYISVGGSNGIATPVRLSAGRRVLSTRCHLRPAIRQRITPPCMPQAKATWFAAAVGVTVQRGYCTLSQKTCGDVVEDSIVTVYPPILF